MSRWPRLRPKPVMTAPPTVTRTGVMELTIWASTSEPGSRPRRRARGLCRPTPRPPSRRPPTPRSRSFEPDVLDQPVAFGDPLPEFDVAAESAATAESDSFPSSDFAIDDASADASATETEDSFATDGFAYSPPPAVVTM